MSTAPGHVPVLPAETIEALNIRPGGHYVDCTYGRGGHSRAILARLGTEGRLLALDRDPEAVSAGTQLAASDGRFRILHAPFSQLRQCLESIGWPEVDGILLDLGVSSPQIDQPERGFSFRHDAELDMRMDPGAGKSAAAWLAHAAESEIAHVVHEYGEERFARAVARAIVQARQVAPIQRTRQLAEIVARAVRSREPGQDPATRTFQAVRIFVNHELEELDTVLPQALAALAPGGRLAVISFHSLEDRKVKHFLSAHTRGRELPPELPLAAADLPTPPLRLVGRARRAGSEEIRENPRARSAILRVAERSAA